MPSEVLAGRYAEALLDNIEDPTLLDEVHDELQAVVALTEDNAGFRAFLEDPSVTEENRTALVHKVLADKVQPLLLNFLDLLLHKHRIDHLGAIFKSFERLVEERRNQMRVAVTTAIPLAADVADRLKRALDVSLGHECILEPRIDARIIAGAIAVYGDQVIDGSARTQLEELRRSLMEAPL